MDERGFDTHPGDGELAAFVDGKASRVEARSIARHLAGCAECRHVVGASARTLREGSGDLRRTRALPSLAAVAAVLLIAVPVAWEVGPGSDPPTPAVSADTAMNLVTSQPRLPYGHHRIPR